mgnify:CR=1 FL=1
MSIAVPLYGFGIGGSSLYYSVVCSTTEPAKKEGRIWVKSSVPMTQFEVGNNWSTAKVGAIVVGGTPGGANPTSANKTLDLINTKAAGIQNRLKLTPKSCQQVQGSAGNWVSVDAYVCHSDTWIQFSSVFSATINITYPAGSTCACTDGTATLTAPDTSGAWTCTVPNAGTWTVSSTDGDKSKSADVVITTDGQTESVTLQYITYLFKNGETYDSLTGGWQGTIDAGKKVIWLNATAGKTNSAYPKSKIDLTNYDTVSAIVDENVSAYGAFSLYIVGTLGQSAVASAILGAAPATRVDLDVSSVTGSYYVVASLYSEKGYSARVTEVSMQ